MKVRVTFTEELLGTASANPALHEEHIASKGPDAKSVAEEVAALGVDGVVEKSMTIFPRDENGCPMLWDYQIKGYFKDAQGMLCRVPGTASAGLKAWRKVIDGLVFVAPRQIRLVLPEGRSLGRCQRPLRAQTAQGERIAISDSETAPAGTAIEFEIRTLNDALKRLVVEWLDYGKLRGVGQWRNSGKGRFEWTQLD